MLSFVAIAQHYAIPTRLLDWSHSPFVAAYFAAKDSLNCNAERFSVCTLLVNTRIRDVPINKALLDHNLNLRIVTVPRAANPNLHAQEGVFSYLDFIVSDLYSNYQRLSIEDALARLENVDGNLGPLLYKFTLEVRLAPEVLWFLDKIGYHAAKLFPGYEGSARAVFDFSHTQPPTSPGWRKIS